MSEAVSNGLLFVGCFIGGMILYLIVSLAIERHREKHK